MSALFPAVPAGELRAMAQRLIQMAESSEDRVDAGSKRSPSRNPFKVHPARLLALATAISKSRKARCELFGTDLFADPAWDILLGLYIAELKGTRISTTSLCSQASVPQTTGLRWLGHLQKAGLVSGVSCEHDGRVQWRSLTPKGSRLMREYLDRYWDQVCSPIPELTIVRKHG